MVSRVKCSSGTRDCGVVGTSFSDAHGRVHTRVEHSGGSFESLRPSPSYGVVSFSLRYSAPSAKCSVFFS